MCQSTQGCSARRDSQFSQRMACFLVHFNDAAKCLCNSCLCAAERSALMSAAAQQQALRPSADVKCISHMYLTTMHDRPTSCPAPSGMISTAGGGAAVGSSAFRLTPDIVAVHCQPALVFGLSYVRTDVLHRSRKGVLRCRKYGQSEDHGVSFS